MNVVGRICCCEIRCQEFLNYLVESEAGRANFHGQVAGDVGRRPTIKMHKVQSRNTRHKIRGRKQNNQLPLIGVPGDEAWPERPLPGDALLQLCHRRHAHLSLSLSLLNISCLSHLCGVPRASTSGLRTACASATSF
jgi:hypothetical protein